MFGDVVNVEKKCIEVKIIVIIVNIQNAVPAKDQKYNEQKSIYTKQGK